MKVSAGLHFFRGEAYLFPCLSQRLEGAWTLDSGSFPHLQSTPSIEALSSFPPCCDTATSDPAACLLRGLWAYTEPTWIIQGELPPQDP